MQSVTPLVSALVTTFNHETFIAHAIESLLDQTYPAVEIIVVDDGSLDSTFELACAYRSRGVRVLRGPRKGPSSAMNVAMAEAKGDVFLLQSGDDMSHRTRAEVQVRALADCDLHAGLPTLIDGQGRPRPDGDFPIFFREAPVDMKQVFKSLYESGNFLCASTVAMKRTAWERIGGFHPGLLQLQDYEYWLRALTAGLVLTVARDRLASYRIHDNNLSVSRHDVRMHRELGTIFRFLGPRIPTAFINAILYGGSFDGLGSDHVDRDILMALLFLRHPVEAVRQIGIDGLIQSLGDARLAADLEDQLNLSFRTVFDLLLVRA